MPQGFFHQSELAASKAPVSLVPKCGACGIYKLCNSPKMPVDGDGREKILIVGEAPGRQEDKRGIPFCGPTGQLLERSLKQVGIDMRRDCWITNSLICRPPENATPKYNQIEYCRPNVIKAIRELKPEKILLLGQPAVESVVGWLWKERVGLIGRWVGWKIPHQKLNAWICPTWHPSYIARNEKEKRDKHPELPAVWKHHLQEFAELEGRPWEVVPDYNKQVRAIMDREEAAAEIGNIIEEGGIAAFDFETNCLKPDWDDARIVSCSICLNGENTIAFPWSRRVAEVMRVFIRSKKVKKIASNLKFEDRWCRKFLKSRVIRWLWDTMIGARIIDNRREISSIKFQSFIWLGVDSYDDHIKKLLRTKGDSKINQVIKEVEMKQLLLYNGLDSLFEYHTCIRQRKELGYG